MSTFHNIVVLLLASAAPFKPHFGIRTTFKTMFAAALPPMARATSASCPVMMSKIPTNPTAAPTSWPTLKRSEEHTSELQSLAYLVCRLLLEKKKKKPKDTSHQTLTS